MNILLFLNSRSKRVWDRHCYSNYSAKWFFTLNSIQKLESKESIVAMNANCETEYQTNISNR